MLPVIIDTYTLTKIHLVTPTLRSGVANLNTTTNKWDAATMVDGFTFTNTFDSKADALNFLVSSVSS